MIITRSISRLILYFSILLLLAACSGGGPLSPAPGNTVNQGIAVDPYIVGAVFQEINPDTLVVLQESSASDESGLFHFAEPLTPGSIVMMVPDTGLHGEAPYHGILRRIVGPAEDGPVTVTPLTTLLANGAAPEELVAAFADAGLTGLTALDLYADPMENLTDMTTVVTDQHLVLLQASMATSAYMEVTGNFETGRAELNDAGHFQVFSSMVAAMKDLLNAQDFSGIVAALANDPDITSPLILGDYILAVVNQHQTIVSLAQENMANNGTFNPDMMDQAVQNVMGNSVAMVKDSYSRRVPITITYDGEQLYHDNCSACHGILSMTDLSASTSADIQTAIDQNFGGMGMLNNLTQGEITAIAEILPAASAPAPNPTPTPTPDPVAIDGAALYGIDCAMCHGQPPSGSTFPNTAGAHAVHTALASVVNDCSVCHLGAAHNGQVDLTFPAGFDALSGPATDNLDGTCSSVICHGGQATPDWWTGSIAVETQCTSCHSSGSSQYNSYSSGEHSRHIRQGYSCTVCHNTNTLATGHFSNLETTDFELSPAATIGGGSTSVGSYSNGTCSSIACHGSQRW